MQPFREQLSRNEDADRRGARLFCFALSLPLDPGTNGDTGGQRRTNRGCPISWSRASAGFSPVSDPGTSFFTYTDRQHCFSDQPGFGFFRSARFGYAHVDYRGVSCHRRRFRENKKPTIITDMSTLGIFIAQWAIFPMPSSSILAPKPSPRHKRSRLSSTTSKHGLERDHIPSPH